MNPRKKAEPVEAEEKPTVTTTPAPDAKPQAEPEVEVVEEKEFPWKVMYKPRANCHIMCGEKVIPAEGLKLMKEDIDIEPFASADQSNTLLIKIVNK